MKYLTLTIAALSAIGGAAIAHPGHDHGHMATHAKTTKTALVCPVTQGGAASRYAGFAVTLMGTGCDTQGVVACNHARTLDLRARRGAFKELVPAVVTADVIARLQTLLDQ